ncbi:MAG: hypothetical protein Q8O18_07830 [Deltaproteobacteria bacterium]|nr:hypothetical protein [Deltaproteobacteria bacterium]
MSKIRDEIEKLSQVEGAVRAGGGKKKIAKQHASGKLTARERSLGDAEK